MTHRSEQGSNTHLSHGHAFTASIGATAFGSPAVGSTPASAHIVACQSAMWIKPSWTVPAMFVLERNQPPVRKVGVRVPPSQLLPLPPRSGWLLPPTVTGDPLSVVNISSVSSHIFALFSAAVRLCSASSTYPTMPLKIAR